MADYRDELRAAHERIAQLEGRNPPREAPNRTPAIVVAALLALVAVGGTISLALARFRSAPPPVVEVSPAPAFEPTAIPVVLGMTWYPQALVAPVFVDIDALGEDPKKEIIGLAWDSRNDETALNVVAFDRDTFAVRWHAGPYPGQWSSDFVHLVVVANRVVVTDSRSNVHLLDLRTGKDAMPAIHLPGGPEYLCEVRDGSPRVLLNPRTGADTTRALDVTTGVITTAPKSLECGLMHNRDRSCAPGLGAGIAAVPCELPSDKGLDARASKRPGMKGFWSTHVLAAQEERVVLGYVDGDNPGGSGGRALGIDPKTRAILWSTPLMPESDKPNTRRVRGLAPLTVLDEGRLLHLYQSAEGIGAYWLVGRDAKTGQLLYRVNVPKSAEASFMSSLSIDGDQAFVIMNQTLHVFDVGTGAVKKSLDRF